MINYKTALDAQEPRCQFSAQICEETCLFQTPIKHHLELMWREWNFHSWTWNIFLVTRDFQSLRQNSWKTKPSRSSPASFRETRYWGSQWPINWSTHVFSACLCNSAARPCVIYEAGTSGDLLAAALAQSDLSPRSVKPQRGLAAVLLCAHWCTESIGVRTGFMDQGNLQHCWVL